MSHHCQRSDCYVYRKHFEEFFWYRFGRQKRASQKSCPAIAAHENWKLRLRSFLAGTSSEKFVAEEICFDDRCDLGKWIYSTGRSQLGTFPGFTALMGHHKMFHYAASNVVTLAQVGKIDEAGKILEMQFSQHSSEVVRELQILRTIVRENSD